MSVEYLTTREVARLLRLNEKKIYTLVSEGGLPAARISGKWLFPKDLVTQWVWGRTQLPPEQVLAALLERVIVLQGSDDPLLDQALAAVRSSSELGIVSARVGSKQGLAAMKDGKAHAASFHLDTNAVQFPSNHGQGYLVDLFSREQVLVVAGGLAGRVRDLSEASAQRLRFAFRQPGSGTRELTNRLLADAAVPEDTLQPVGPFNSHLEVAMAVVSGRADAGVCIRQAAEAGGLTIRPLRQERYRLAVPGSFFGQPSFTRFLAQFLDFLRGSPRDRMPGYAFDNLGCVVPTAT